MSKKATGYKITLGVVKVRKWKKGKFVRTSDQYRAFRRAFAKWLKSYRKGAAYSKVNSESCTLYNAKGEMLATYFAPDYTRYMKYALRGLKRVA